MRLSPKFFRWVEGVSVLLIIGAAVYALTGLRQEVGRPRLEGHGAGIPTPLFNSLLLKQNGMDEGFNELVARRDLFNLPEPPKPEVSQAVPVALEKPVEPPRNPEILPGHLKVVAVAVDDKVQLVIEDTSLKQTFFIESGPEQDGFRIERVDGNKIFLAYQGVEYIIPFGR